MLQTASSVRTLVLALSMLLVAPGATHAAGRWVVGDFHNHTVLTDGSETQARVASEALGRYGLNFLANSEHGGFSRRDPNGAALASPIPRWRTLVDYSFPLIKALRITYPRAAIVQGVEWNVPGHDHANVGIVSQEPTAISDFEYVFDHADSDLSRAGQGLAKRNATHDDAVAAVAWLQARHRSTSYVVFGHPSRRLGYTATDLRAFNDAAPDVAFGMEGLPGHQKTAIRGGYDATVTSSGSVDATATLRARTWGGADYMTARVGGLWDSLLGEGRRFWVFANSDFHGTASDFWPGEYTKTYVHVDRPGLPALVSGLRSGNSFCVHGDLIDRLDFRVVAGGRRATMGQTIKVRRGSSYLVVVRFRSLRLNSAGRRPVVHHVDVISGDVTGRAASGTAAYGLDTDRSTRLLKRFDRRTFKVTPAGWRVMTLRVPRARRSAYLRLRGTDLAPGVAGETDRKGEPLPDSLAGANDADKAFADLWFYSNPIFVRVR